MRTVGPARRSTRTVQRMRHTDFLFYDKSSSDKRFLTLENLNLVLVYRTGIDSSDTGEPEFGSDKEFE